MDDYEDILMQFIESRIPRSQWKTLISRYAIQARIEDDDEEEIKDKLWDLFLSNVKWSKVLTEVMLKVQDEEDEEDEEDEDVTDDESDEDE